MRFEILTLFPELVRSVVDESILGRAQKNGIISVNTHNIRDYTTNKHRKVDDTPYGGGMGMLMATQPIYDCYKAVYSSLPEGRTKAVYMSPRGRIFDQNMAKELSEYDNLILLCGHYEGVDQRVIDEIIDEEISIGDYVLTGGEMPACIVVDAVSRLIDGVLSDKVCYQDESISSGLLEYPQYTRPPVFNGKEVPEILLSGHHGNIDKWRLEKSLELTKERRPDLYEKYMLEHPIKEPKKKKKVSASVDN
ncbi:MAG: tRNA (guanosine(37)-N1)-methyltransferase TrmD [Clostridia bacterium]|nr:tRNA (guanosine(37)-N1)-methyltransferase TrmD [Clostridia bacterium]